MGGEGFAGAVSLVRGGCGGSGSSGDPLRGEKEPLSLLDRLEGMSGPALVYVNDSGEFVVLDRLPAVLSYGARIVEEGGPLTQRDLNLIEALWRTFTGQHR